MLAGKKLRSLTLEVLNRFDVRPPDPERLINQLSGGNQQKFVMGRELISQPKLLLCSEPTRGVDVGSIEQIHSELRKARTLGVGILLVSSQLDELMALSDRIMVMREGRVVAEFDRHADETQAFDELKIGRAMLGAQQSA
jgi:simple sugar transport system ATP-binding protein